MEIATSILNVKEEDCVKTIYKLETAKTDYFHIDVMDGEFVENNTVEKMTKYCEYLKNITNIPLDVHLMVKDVMAFIKSFLVFEPRNITIHYEAIRDIEEMKKVVSYIKENNCKAGISIKPETSLEEILDILQYVHTVLIMTVEPGKGGQELIRATIQKIKELRKYIDENNLEIDIEADGGINLENVEEIRKAGCDIVVAGTCILKSGNFKETIEKLRG